MIVQASLESTAVPKGLPKGKKGAVSEAAREDFMEQSGVLRGLHGDSLGKGAPPSPGPPPSVAALRHEVLLWMPE